MYDSIHLGDMGPKIYEASMNSVTLVHKVRETPFNYVTWIHKVL